MAKKWVASEIPPQANLETAYYTPRATSKTFYYTPSKNKVTNNVSDILPSIGNNSDSIEEAKKKYKNSKIIYNILENKFRENAKNNNVILPYKTGEHTSISNYAPSNFTILENSKIDENKNYKMLPTYSNLMSSKNNKNITKVNSMSSNPLDLDITSKLKSGVENKKRYDEYVSQDNVKQDLINLRDARNDIALNKYNLDLTRVNNHDINTYDKTFGRFVGGGKSMLPNINTTYTREDGVEVALPTYNDLKEQKTVQSYETGVGKFLGDAASNIGRIAVSSAINSVIPYAGTVAYFGDMFVDQYNNNLLNGYDETSSLLNASIGTATEAVTEKILGGIGGKLFGGSSEMSEGLAKGISKLIKNKRIVSIFSNGASEAIEEFVQTFTEKLNEQLTLEKKFNPKEIFSLDTLSEAIYSAGIGALTGGVLSGIGKIDPNISKIVDDNNTKNNTSKIDSMENTVPSNTKYTTESIRFNENDVNALESLTLNTKFFEDNNIPVKATLNDVHTTLLNNNANKDLTDKLSYYNKEYAKTDFFDFVENVANGTIDYKTIENNILPKAETEIIEEQNKINEPFSINEDISSLTDKQKILLKEFENYSNNSDKSHQLYNVIDGLQRMNDTQQYHITTTEEMAKMEGLNLVKNEDGKYELNNKPYIPRGFNYKNGEIYINLDAGEVSGTQAVYHEIFEGFKKSSPETYDSLKTMVQDIIGKEYDTELTKYTEMYGNELTNSIEDEFLNDKFGEIAESNNFIKKIVDDRNVFEKFIDKLKNAIKYITSDKEQRKLIRLKNKLENEFSKRYKETNFNNKDSGISFSVEEDKKYGSYWNIETGKDIFKGITNKSDLMNKAFNYLVNGNKNFKVIKDKVNGEEIQFRRISGKEYVRGRSNYKLSTTHYEQKMRMAPSIDDLIENAGANYHSPLTHNNKRFPNGFDNHQGLVGIDNNLFRYIVRVGNTNDNKSIFYDVSLDFVDNKKGDSHKVHQTDNSSSLINKESPFRENNISQSNKNVNNKSSSIKYSIQEAENNTQELKKSSFSFDKNAKRYDDLNQTNYIEYFTKENGDIRINLIDTNNNLVNQFSSSPSKEISKLLGENIGKYILKNSSNDTKRIYIGNDINNLGKETDYFMNHRPSNDYGNASNFENNMSGIFEHPEWYMNMNEPYNIQSLNALKKVRNNPEADITIYRATIGDKINPGDWVTPSKKYAEYHNQSQFNGEANILELKVKAKDVLFAGDDINEFGYFPSKTTSNSSMSNKNISNYIIDNHNTIDEKSSSKDNHNRELTKYTLDKTKNSKVRDNDGKLMLMYHGSPNGTYEQLIGGTYFTSNKNYAERYKNISASSISYGKTENSPKVYEAYLNIEKPFDISDSATRKIYINEYIKGGNSFSISPNLTENEYKKIDKIDWTEVENLKEFLQENGYDYDGIVADEGADGGYGSEVINRGKSYIPFNEDQIIKANKNNTEYSLTSNKNITNELKLQNKNMVLPTFKENNSSNEKLGNDVLPTVTDIKKINENKIPSFKNSEYTPDDVSKNVDLKSNELKKQNLNKINNNKVSIDKLVDARNETLKNIDNQIKKKRELYNSKKNKNTKIANIIQQQIISMESSKKSITEAYKQRIERLEDRNRKLSNKENITNLQRKNASEQYRELAESIVIDNIDSWKDKKIGLAYKTEKMERNIYDIIPDKNVAKTVVDTYITPLKIAEVNQKNFINEYVDRIKKLGLTEEESVAVQLLGEAKFNISTMEADTERAQKILKREDAKADVKDNAQFYLDAVEYINANKLDIDKIQNAVKEFRKIYNELFIKVNSVLKEQGYKEMDYKKDYFPHFTERKATSKFGMLMEKLGWKKINNDIPTDIAGITDTFKPGKTYFNHLQRRYGNITEYNALKGFDNYIGGASNLIYLTEHIQKLRALENEIRYIHSEKGIQEQYNEIIKSNIDTDTKEAQINQLFANASNPLNNFVTELRSYTDGIANKKSELDRRIEQAFNRGIYSTMSNIQGRVSANMVGLNISSALTNFIPITQAYSQVSTKNMLQAIKLSIKNSVSSDSFVENSEFLSNRLIKSEKLCQTKLEKFSDKANIMFDAIDSFTSNVVVRSKYLENIEKGMSPTAALKNADTFANNVMAGRDKASLPTIFNSKNPFIKLFSSFQLEVNNQYKYMLKDLPSDLKDEAVSKLIGAFAKMFFGAWFYNLFSEKITGRKSAFSPADIVLDGINTMSNENASFFENSMTVAKDVASELPFLGNILGGGRLPISSALPDVSNSVESVSTLLNKETKKSTKKTALNNLVKELSKPVFYIIPPFGGGQAKKTIEGLSMYTKDIPGSYTSSGRLRFTADEGFLPVVQAGIFGQYASKNAREYFDNSYSPLTEKQIEEFSSLGIGINEYRTYLKKYSELNKIKADVDPEGNTINGSAKAKKIYELLNNNEKYSENEVNYILSKLSTENETITLDDLMLIDNDLESYKYYFSLSSDGRDKYRALILNNGIDQKKYISSIQKIKNIKEKYANVKNPYTGTKKEKYKTYISNSKKNEIFNVINESNISKAEKIILFKEAGYSITNYKKYMFSYINSLNISKSKKEEIWKYLYEN